MLRGLSTYAAPFEVDDTVRRDMSSLGSGSSVTEERGVMNGGVLETGSARTGTSSLAGEDIG